MALVCYIDKYPYMNTYYYNMAPDEKQVKSIHLTFRDCNKAILQLKVLCRQKKITDSAHKISLAESCADDDVIKWFNKNFEEKFTYREFVRKLRIENDRRALIRILKKQTTE